MLSPYDRRVFAGQNLLVPPFPFGGTARGTTLSWYIGVFKNYANFSGRSRRKEYWMFVLFHSIALVLLYGLAMALAVPFATDRSNAWVGAAATVPLILYALGSIVPTLAVIVRRLHDQGKSGAWYFMAFIPAGVGTVFMLIYMCTDGQRHPNQYGPDPKAPPGSQQSMPYSPGFPQQPGYAQQGYPQQPGAAPQPAYAPNAGYQQNPGYTAQPGYPPQPGYQQQPGYPPQQGFPQQPGNPNYRG
jgi:uncharacterized membrane protein YhaH (DUF805 family)